MNRAEILTNLRTLGLEAGATAEDIHSSFRKLARELHPDITGSKSDFRFRQITGAYTALKNITPEELAGLVEGVKPGGIYDYYNEEKRRREDDERIDTIINKYEAELKSFHIERSGGEDLDMAALSFRMKSKNIKVITAAVKHAGNLVNRVEFRRVFTEVLQRKEINEIDEDIGDIVRSLPFDDGARRLIALDVANNAGNFPTGLIIALIGTDADVMESFLLHVKPDDVAIILRRWPSGRAMNTNILRKLLDSDDARILVPVLAAMKDNFPLLAVEHKKRLHELENHDTAAVRAWAKKQLGF